MQDKNAGSEYSEAVTVGLSIPDNAYSTAVTAGLFDRLEVARHHCSDSRGTSTQFCLAVAWPYFYS